MLHEQTMSKLLAMKMNGLAEAYEEQRRQSQSGNLSFEERFAMLVERQWLWRENRSLEGRLHWARLKQNACIEDIDYRTHRGLARGVIEQLTTMEWVKFHQNCIITGSTGVGKTYLACALAQKACRAGYSAVYYVATKLFRELGVAQVDGSLPKLLKRLLKANLLVIDDWGMETVKPGQYREYLELLDDRQGAGATLITSQYAPNHWHEIIGDATVADAILDRLIHNAHRIDLKGDSLRKPKDKGNNAKST